MAGTGNWWHAQQAFEECSGGLSIAEWCAVARDTCCALCPMPPITGPATTVVWTCGAFLNLFLVLMLTQEAPYNMVLQMLGTVGVMVAVIIRSFFRGGGLSAWHYYYCALYVVSCLPHMFACALSSIAAMSGVGGGDHAQFGALYASYHQYIEAHDDLDGPKRKGYRLKDPVTQKRYRPWHSKNVKRKEGDPPPPDPNKPIYVHEGRLGPSQIVSLPRPHLALVIKWVFLVHILCSLALFVWIFFFLSEFTQPNCSEKYKFDRYCIGMGVVAASFLLISILLWAAMAYALRPNSRQHVLMAFVSLFHSNRLRDWAWLHTSQVKWVIGLGSYSVWVAIFIYFYIDALQNFLLLGNDPWDFGQLNWIVSSFMVIAVIGRSVFDMRDSYRKKFNDLSAIEDDPTASHLPNGRPIPRDERGRAHFRLPQRRTPSNSPSRSPRPAGEHDRKGRKKVRHASREAPHVDVNVERPSRRSSMASSVNGAIDERLRSPSFDVPALEALKDGPKPWYAPGPSQRHHPKKSSSPAS